MKGPDQNQPRPPSAAITRLQNFRPSNPEKLKIWYGADTTFAFKLLEEKYGKEFMDDYRERSLGAMFEDDEGNAEIPDEITEKNLRGTTDALSAPRPDVLPEIGNLIERMQKIKNIAAIAVFARKELGLTEAQVENGAEETRRSLEKEDQDSFSQLEQDPMFQKGMVIGLTPTVMKKKFGEEFMAGYNDRMINRAQGDEDGDSRNLEGASSEERLEMAEKYFVENFELEENDPLIPEVAGFERKLREIKTTEELSTLLKAENITLTDEEIQKAKRTATIFAKGPPPSPK